MILVEMRSIDCPSPSHPSTSLFAYSPWPQLSLSMPNPVQTHWIKFILRKATLRLSPHRASNWSVSYQLKAKHTARLSVHIIHLFTIRSSTQASRMAFVSLLCVTSQKRKLNKLCIIADRANA